MGFLKRAGALGRGQGRVSRVEEEREAGESWRRVGELSLIVMGGIRILGEAGEGKKRTEEKGEAGEGWKRMGRSEKVSLML